MHLPTPLHTRCTPREPCTPAASLARSLPALHAQSQLCTLPAIPALTLAPRALHAHRQLCTLTARCARSIATVHAQRQLCTLPASPARPPPTPCPCTLTCPFAHSPAPLHTPTPPRALPGPCTLTDKCARAHCAQPAAHARLHTHVDPGSFARSALSVQACTVPRSLAHATLPPCTLASPCAHTGAVHTRRMKLARSPLPVPAHALHDGSVALHAHLQVCKLMLRQQALHAQLRGLAHSPPAVQVHTEP